MDLTDLHTELRTLRGDLHAELHALRGDLQAELRTLRGALQTTESRRLSCTASYGGGQP